MAFSCSHFSSSCFKSNGSPPSISDSKLPTNLHTSIRLPLTRSLFPLTIRAQNPNRTSGTLILSAGGNDNLPPPNDGGGNGGGGGDDEDDYEEAEFGPIMKFEEVMKEAEARGATLPNDMLEAAKSVGIRRLLLLRYLDLQGSVWPLGMLMRSCSMLRDRMLADPSFLFKVGTEIVIDSCCATFAEVQKRGMDFRAEFELYAGDLLVGIVVDIALVGMLAPYARIGKPSVKSGFFANMAQAVEEEILF